MSFAARSGLWVALLLLASTAARADRVMVLELRGDAHGRLRGQIEQAVKSAHQLELVPLSRVREAARGHGVSEARAMTPVGVALLAPALNASVAVGGAVGSTFLVRLFDPLGQELWSKELPVRHGLISPENARKLARAIAAAAAQVKATKPPPPSDEVTLEPVPLATPEPAPAPAEPSPPPSANPPPMPVPPPAPVATASEAAEPEWTPRPRWLTLRVGPTLSLRSYCARPGVSSCGQYDALDPSQRPPGGSVQFDAKVPYAGVRIGLELFPLASAEGPLTGLGLIANYRLGMVRTDVSLEGEGGSTPVKTVRSLDHRFDVELAFRRFFDRSDRLVGWYGVRAGIERLSFDVDKSVAAVLPGSHRTFPVLAADLRYPLHPRFALDASARLLLAADPGTNEIVPFGTSGSGFGYGGSLGADGLLTGRFGYFAQLDYLHFSDAFHGQGTQWPQGGVAAETYLSLELGLTISF